MKWYELYSHPLNLVSGLLPDEVDPFQHVGDVVYPSFAYAEAGSNLVEVDHAIRGRMQYLEEALGQCTQG